MVIDQDIVLNLLGLATVILAFGLIFIGRWVKRDAMNVAFVAQAVAMTCNIAAAFIIK